ncbi:hypothetical protein [Bosea sp. BK604]|uniref:hypothetical protein n=1 Tax=Bosea sp. BK604 TaxID=2512180 RepID=UPI0010451693|nr:hypothetical protein [Bosea sp. BK604]TCR68192.1 hypothetical protein EV560_10218 [Bosea sp. BK604]
MSDDHLAAPTIVLALQSALSELMAAHALTCSATPIQGLRTARRAAEVGVERISSHVPASTPALARIGDELPRIMRGILDNAEEAAVFIIDEERRRKQ